MSHADNAAPMYICPMHADVRQAAPGKCPTCGMALVPAGTRFAILHHIMGSKLHLAAMAALMIAILAAIMMMR